MALEGQGYGLHRAVLYPGGHSSQLEAQCVLMGLNCYSNPLGHTGEELVQRGCTSLLGGAGTVAHMSPTLG